MIPPPPRPTTPGLAALRRAWLRAAAPLLLSWTLGLAPSASAAPRAWTGLAGPAFSDPANWDALPADDLLSDLATFSGPPPANQPVLDASRSVSGLVFATSSGGWTLSAAAPAHVLSLGASGLDATAQASGLSSVSADL
ncbi:MAG: hypothetical protein H7067_19470, partial [Burkholderiales bacterium]|nr:hypothetical protein [Opitutaceae bacterium]